MAVEPRPDAWLRGPVPGVPDELQPVAHALLQARKVRGFGELIVNNKASNLNPKLQRKAAIDSPTMRAMFDAAQRSGGVIQMHTEDDEDSLADIEALTALHSKDE